MLNMTKLKKYSLTALFILLPIIGLILLILPSDYFDDGESMCVSVMLFDTECYACGMTRGIMHLIHGEFSKAYDFNILSLIVFPLIVVYYFVELVKFRKTLNKEK